MRTAPTAAKAEPPLPIASDQSPRPPVAAAIGVAGLALLGLRSVRQLSRRFADVVVLLLAVLIVAAHLYFLNFAWG